MLDLAILLMVLLFGVLLGVGLGALLAPRERRVIGLPAVAFYRHVRRGSTYAVYGDARVQSSSRRIDEGDTVVVYQDKDGELWVRPTDEFHDGRFVGIDDDGARRA